MKIRSIWEHKQYLDTLFAKGDQINYKINKGEIKSTELLSHWSRYLCVLVSGWIEVSVRSIFREYIKKRSSKELERYALNKLKMRSAYMKNIIDLSSQFSVEMSQALQLATDGPIEDAVNTIVGNRHKIAHGGTCDISYVRLRDYYADVVKAIQLLEEQCLT